LGIPIQTEQSLPKANYHFTVTAVDQCAGIENATTQIAQKISFTAHDLLPAMISTPTLQFLLSFRPVNKEIRHPVYSGSAKIRSSVPLYLEYRKLMIYFFAHLILFPVDCKAVSTGVPMSPSFFMFPS